MAIQKITFDAASVSSKMDADINHFLTSGVNGIFYGILGRCQASVSNNYISFQNGYVQVYGRRIYVESGTKISVSLDGSAYGYVIIKIESKIDLINDKAELNVKERLYETFGVTVTGFDISAIEIDKESEGYQELRNISKGMAGRKAEIDIQHYEESLRIQREEGQYAAHMGTKQTNLGAYETEVKGEVGVESAKALGKMGENGAGRIDIGGDGGQGGGAGFNPVSLMAGLAVGGAVAKNIGGTLDQTMNASGNVPPAIPTVTFHVAIDGKAVGPFETAKVIEMINSGQVLKDTLIWKQGTPNWVKAGELKEFSDSFPPDLPPSK